MEMLVVGTGAVFLVALFFLLRVDRASEFDLSFFPPRFRAKGVHLKRPEQKPVRRRKPQGDFERYQTLDPVKAAVAVVAWSGVSVPPMPNAIVERIAPISVVESVWLPPRLAGMLLRLPPFGVVIWLSRATSAAERRASLFHELGHLLCHPRPQTVYRTSVVQASEGEEDEADLFERNVLMPEAWLRADLLGPRPPEIAKWNLALLANRYGVTIRAMRKRLKELALDDLVETNPLRG